MAPWKETGQKGIFSRPIGENETFIKLVGDVGLPLNREHWAINSTATITPSGSLKSADLFTCFQTAWAHLRFHHPSLAIEVASDDVNFTYTVPADGAALDTWVSQTFSVATDATSAADVIATFQPTPFAKLVYIPNSNQLVLHTTHWRTDGIGGLVLLDEFLALASAWTSLADPTMLAWGTETIRLTPSVEDTFAMPKESRPEIKERAAAKSGTFAHNVGAIGIPYLGDANTVPAATKAASLTLSPKETSQIIAACKSRGMTITTALHASVAAANYIMAAPEDRDTKHCTCTIRFGLRPYLPGPAPASDFAAGLYTTGWMKRVDPGTSWAERALAYQDEYRPGLSRDYLEAHREYAAQLCTMMRSPPADGDNATPPSGVDISNVGVAERMIRRSFGTAETGFEVTAVSIGIEMLTRQAVVFTWTFRDQLNLSIVYNESFHTVEQVNQLVGVVKDQLQEGLGVEA